MDVWVVLALPTPVEHRSSCLQAAYIFVSIVWWRGSTEFGYHALGPL